jgi:hypothetical protein
MALNPGKTERLITETTTGAGETSREGAVISDSLLATLWVDNVTSGTLTVTVYTLTDTGKEVELFSFPVLTAPTTNILLKKAGISLQRFRVKATYTGVCTYEVYIRAVSGIGESSTRILGSQSWEVGQTSVGTTPLLLIPAAIVDRRGFIIRNFSTSGQLIYVAESSTSATLSVGFPIPPGETFAVDVASGAEVYVVSSAAGADVRYAQAGG